jgi:hypothetical protein
MATIESIRSDPSGTSPRATDGAAVLSLAAFRSGGDEDRLTDLLAFALAVEADAPPSPEEVHRHRQQAVAELHGHAFRVLHNRIEEIRREAVTEHLAHLPRPLGFAGTLGACLAALLVAAVAAGWLSRHPDVLARLLAVLGG